MIRYCVLLFFVVALVQEVSTCNQGTRPYPKCTGWTCYYDGQCFVYNGNKVCGCKTVHHQSIVGVGYSTYYHGSNCGRITERNFNDDRGPRETCKPLELSYCENGVGFKYSIYFPYC